MKSQFCLLGDAARNVNTLLRGPPARKRCDQTEMKIGEDKDKMKHLTTALFLLVLATPGFAQGKLEFPSLGAKILEKQFPQFDRTNVTLTSLRKYRTELEYFRDAVLEGYNTAVSEYVAELGQFDKRLESARKNGAISASDYQRMHEHLADEYNNAGAKGDLLKPYFTYLKKYQSEAAFVINEINNKEKELIKF